MLIVDFTREEIDQIRRGNNSDWKAIGSGSYGSVYKSPKNPGKVIKIQEGDYGEYNNEISKQFQAYVDKPKHYTTPKLGETGFFPREGWDSTVEVPGTTHRSPAPTTPGISFIEMDEAEWTETEGGKRYKSLANAKALIELYRKAGINHNDTHGGNIKYNSKTDKAVVMDYGLATDSSSHNPIYDRATWVQAALKASGNKDMLGLWDEGWMESNNDIEFELQRDKLNTDKYVAAKAAREEWIKQGEDVAMKVGPDIEPVNWTDTTQTKVTDTPKPIRYNKGKPVVGLTLINEELNKAYNNLKKVTRGGVAARGRRVAGQAFDNMSPGKAAGAFGAADFIPSVQTIRTGESEGLAAAGQAHLKDVGHGLVYGAGVGLTTMAVPALTLPATAVGGAMLLDQGLQSINEATRVATGDTALSKVRQAAGITPRSGNVESSAAEKFTREMARNNNPDLVQITARDPKKDISSQVKDTPVPDLAHRLRLAGQRFNPKRGEFGITELLFGR